MQVRFLLGAHGFVAQLVEQLALNETVVGSNPTEPTDAGSANGRLADFESVYLGPNPSPAADSTRYARSQL